MSEFTDGLLVQKSHAFFAQVALTDLVHPYVYKVLNAHWVVIVFQDSNPSHEPVHSWILRHSHEFPMLWFDHAEDEGWGYRIFHKGREKASFAVQYNISLHLVQDLAEQLHPGLDFYDAWMTGALDIDPLSEQVEASDDYKQSIASQYVHPGVEEFAAFELSSETLERLRMLLTPEMYETPLHEPSQVERFLTLLNLEDMRWVSYYTLSRSDSKTDLDEEGL